MPLSPDNILWHGLLVSLLLYNWYFLAFKTLEQIVMNYIATKNKISQIKKVIRTMHTEHHFYLYPFQMWLLHTPTVRNELKNCYAKFAVVNEPCLLPPHSCQFPPPWVSCQESWLYHPWQKNLLRYLAHHSYTKLIMGVLIIHMQFHNDMA